MTKLILIIKKSLSNIGNLNLRYQLIIAYIPISLISLLIVGIISYRLMSSTVDVTSRNFINETIKIISSDITKKIDQYEEIASTVSLDDNLLSVLADQNNDYNYYIKLNKVKQKLYILTQNLIDIKSIFVYSSISPTIIRSDYNIIYNDMNYKDVPGFYTLAADIRTKVWSTKSLAGYDPEEGNYLYLLRSIPDFGSSNGLIQMQVREDSIFKIYKESTFGNGSTIFIADKKGLIISHPDKKKISTMINDGIAEKLVQNTASFTTWIDGNNFLVVYKTFESAGWKLIATIPMNIIESQNQRLLTVNLVMILLSINFVVLVSIWVSSRIARPLERVGKAMLSVERGDFGVRIDYEKKNEIGKIYKRYNAMVEEIESLMDTIRKEEKQKKEAYIHALQAQIKPHFLYNTLFTIKCLASIKKQPEIEELLDSLIKLLMASISKGGEFVKFREEIKYIENFILIQKYRIGDKFEVKYEFDPEINDFFVLKLLIQPIVENALIHGIGKDDCVANLNIYGSVEENDLIIRIRDNGKGMDADKINGLLGNGETVNKSAFSGMGIKNVNDRIKLYFGDEYGLYYSNDVEHGTEAVIRLPIIKDERGIEAYV